MRGELKVNSNFYNFYNFYNFTIFTIAKFNMGVKYKIITVFLYKTGLSCLC